MIKKVLFVTLIIILIFMISIEKTKQQDEILIASSMPQSSGLKAWEMLFLQLQIVILTMQMIII